MKIDKQENDPTERLDCWADGASFQIIAVTKSGDPVDCSSDEARGFAQKILQAVKGADR